MTTAETATKAARLPSIVPEYDAPPAIVLDEPVTVWLAVGGALVVGGIVAAQGVSPPRVKRKRVTGQEQVDGYETAG
jgi:hypothetical protein